MAKALIVGEIKNSAISKVTLEIASKAKELGMETAAIVFGAGADAAKGAGKAGVSSVSHVDSDEYSGELAAKVISETVKNGGYDTLFIPNTWFGRDIAGRVSALLDAGVISDVVELSAEGDKLVARKPVYAGKAYVKLAHKGGVRIFTIRPNVFGVVESGSDAAPAGVSVDFNASSVKRTALKASQGGKIGLTEADIIVSGGRGVKGPEFFPVIQEMADLLGGAMGASRATVDAGWIDHSHQVGQTGKTVSPTLYIAIGISGAIQHLAGMGSSRYIVAVNKDAEAPIFKVTTYGVVDDLFVVVPPMVDEIKKLKG